MTEVALYFKPTKCKTKSLYSKLADNNIYDNSGRDLKHWHDGDVSNYGYSSTLSPDGLLASGYVGNPSSSYEVKYAPKTDVGKVYANDKQITKMLSNTAAATELYKKKAVYSNGPEINIVNDTGYAYNNPKYFTNYSLKAITNTGGEGYAGFYNQYNYTGKIETTTYSTATGINGRVGDVSEITSSNNAAANFGKYGVHMVMSGISLVPTSANGIFSEPLQVMGTYERLIDKADGVLGEDWSDYRELDFVGKYYDDYSNYAGSRDTINDIVIHNPVSTEFCESISMAETNSGYDQRVGALDDKDPLNPTEVNKSKKDYWITGKEFQVFYSDFGSLYDPTGSFGSYSWSNSRGIGNLGDASTVLGDGTIVNSGRGYMDMMDTSRWVGDRYMSVPCSFTYYNTSGTLVTHPANTWISMDAIGAKSIVTKSKRDVNGKMVYGTTYKFTATTSMVEVADAKIIFNSVASNYPYTVDIFSNRENSNRNRFSGMAYYNAYNTDTVDLVGRIGNLAIQDTGDYRYSQYFKKTAPGWLIDGIVRNTYIDQPNKIVSTKLNIFGDVADDSVFNHTSTSTTYMENTDGTLAGKAGQYEPFPLTPKANPVKEFQTELIRPGYPIYMDLETIGNYTGINYKWSAGSNVKTFMLDDTEGDERYNYVDIIPYYWLLNTDTGVYTKIDIYYGNNGNREVCYEFGTTIADDFEYRMNWKEEAVRRNYSPVEKKLNEALFDDIKGVWDVAFPFMYASDYLGTASKIRLDQANRTYIGSSIKYGGMKVDGTDTVKAFSGAKTYAYNTYNDVSTWVRDFYSDGDLLPEFSYITQGQRWHFTLNLPSTTYVVPHNTTTYYTKNSGQLSFKQKSIEEAHEKLYADNKNSVIVCALNITASGDIWKLAYDGDSVNKPEGTGFKIFENGKIYTPPTGYENYPIVAVLDPNQTSADDLKQTGTN